MVKLSIIIPCLNEEDSISYAVNKAKLGIKITHLNGEILVVDNGSKDKSIMLAKKEGARVVKCKIKGYGAALRLGFTSAHGNFIVIGDCDGSYDFLLIDKFVNKLKEGCDFVIGSRMKGDIYKKAMPFLHHYIGTPILTFILNLFFGSKISDCNSGMRGFTKKTIKDLRLESDGMEIASEMLVKAAILNLKIKEIPINYYADLRKVKKSHLNTWEDGWKHLKLLFFYAPHWIFTSPGIVFFIIGSFLVLSQVNGKLVMSFLHMDLHFMILGVFLGLLGFTLIQMGVGLELFSSKKGFAVGFLNKYINQIFKFERTILLGLLTFLIGFSIDLFILIKWIELGFDKIVYWRQALVSTYIMVIGLQFIFFSFYYNVLNMFNYNNKQ